MKVFVLLKEDNSIINIYSHAQDAISETAKYKGSRVEEYTVINNDTDLKPITSVDTKVYDAKNMDSFMPFGKYKGKAIGDIIEEDPCYIRWAVNNLNFSINEECLDFLSEQLQRKGEK